ncbi:MAG: hypothetical protein PVJ39_07595 [Gammaproteobacteria bacterium]
MQYHSCRAPRDANYAVQQYGASRGITTLTTRGRNAISNQPPLRDADITTTAAIVLQSGNRHNFDSH